MVKAAKIHLVIPPEESGPPCAGLFTPAHLAYRIGRDFRLYRARGQFYLRRGLMIADSIGASAAGGGELAGQILRECMLMNYEGVMLDISGRQERPVLSMLSALQPALERHGLKLYLPQECICNISALRIITAAPADGSVTALLRRICAANKGRGFALNLPVRSSEYRLPGRGKGRLLSPGEAQAMAKAAGGGIFMSRELEAMYSVLSDERGERLILWDDANTMAMRVRSAFAAGAESVFIAWPEVRHFWQELEPLLRQIVGSSGTAEAEHNANHR